MGLDIAQAIFKRRGNVRLRKLPLDGLHAPKNSRARPVPVFKERNHRRLSRPGRCGHADLPASVVEPYLQGFVAKLAAGDAEERAAAAARAARPSDAELGLSYFQELRDSFGPGGDAETEEGSATQEDILRIVEEMGPTGGAKGCAVS